MKASDCSLRYILRICCEFRRKTAGKRNSRASSATCGSPAGRCRSGTSARVALSAAQRHHRPIEIRPPVAENKPVVSLLLQLIEIEGGRDHGIAVLRRLGDFRPGG